MSLSISYLEKIHESAKLTTVVKEVINTLLAAINDWPNPISDLAEYENEIYKVVGENINRKKLEDYISKIDYAKKAWEAESLSQLIEVYNYYEKDKPLKEILKEIKEKIKNQEESC
jgi:hypothetical protein